MALVTSRSIVFVRWRFFDSFIFGTGHKVNSAIEANQEGIILRLAAGRERPIVGQRMRTMGGLRYSAVMFGFALSCAGQTYVTNYVTADPSFRRVDGKLYNVEKSVLWIPFEGECRAVTSNGIVLQKFKVNRVYKTEPVNELQSIGAYSGTPPIRHLVSENKVMGQKFMVRNYPKGEAASGHVIKGKAIRVGTFDHAGETLELWDFGAPNIVRVVTVKK